MAKDKTIAVLAADAFQDSEYFLPKVEIEKLGVRTEVVSLGPDPIEIYSFFDRIGHLEVQKTIAEANPDDYIGVLIPGGAKSPAILARTRTSCASSGRSAAAASWWPRSVAVPS